MLISLTANRGVVAGLAIAALGIVGCSTSPTSSNNQPPSPTPNDVDVVMGASTLGAGAFSPDSKSVSLAGAANASVRFVNLDVGTGIYGSGGVTHHIVSDDGTSFDAGSITPDATATVHLAAGTYPFHCAIHPTMTGSVTVSP
jgi:plastocyanin